MNSASDGAMSRTWVKVLTSSPLVGSFVESAPRDWVSDESRSSKSADPPPRPEAESALPPAGPSSRPRPLFEDAGGAAELAAALAHAASATRPMASIVSARWWQRGEGGARAGARGACGERSGTAPGDPLRCMFPPPPFHWASPPHLGTTTVLPRRAVWADAATHARARHQLTASSRSSCGRTCTAGCAPSPLCCGSPSRRPSNASARELLVLRHGLHSSSCSCMRDLRSAGRPL